MNRTLDYLAALAFVAALAIACASPVHCTTDTECAAMHGGDGGPMPIGECARYDCGE